MFGNARSPRGWLAPFAVAVVCGAAVRVLVAWHVFPVTPLGDELYYAETAVYIARGEGHVYGPHRMAARWPPAQAALMAPLVDTELIETHPDLLVELAQRGPQEMQPRDRAFLAPLIGLQVGLGALLPGLTALLAWTLFGQRAAFAAGMLAALNPAFVASSHALWSETLFAVLLTAALTVAVRWRERPGVLLAIGSGVLFGLAGLTRELGLPIAAGVGAWWVCCSQIPRRKAVAHAALLGIAAALVVAPWTLRNFERFERLVPVSTVGWMGLREGNTLSSTEWFSRDWPAVREFRLRYVAEADEMARMDLARAEALELIAAEQPAWLPRKLVLNLGELASPVADVFFKIRQGAYGEVSQAAVRSLLLVFGAFTVCLFAAAFCGIFSAGDAARRSLPAFVFGPLLVVHVIANAFPKYRLPLEPVLLCYAGAWLTAAGGRAPGRRDALRAAALFALVAALGLRGFAPQALRIWRWAPTAAAAEVPPDAAGVSNAEPPRPQRVVLISMDTVRADRVGGPEQTPAIARLAAEGASFDAFYAASNYTIPSHMSMFTGLDPMEHGVTLDAARLSPAVPTLAELFRAAGYRTRAFHEGAYVDARFGFARGFEIYRRHPRVEVVRRSLPSVLGWVRARGDERWFLFLHSYAAHFPYGGYERYRSKAPQRGLPDDAELAALRERFPGNQPLSGAARRALPFELRRKCTLYNQLAETHASLLPCGGWVLDDEMLAAPDADADLAALLASYDARIRGIDAAIAALRAELESLGQWEDTLLIVTADHGEAFYEHGLPRHEYVPFDEVLRVPLVISWPRFFANRGGLGVAGLAWHLDLLPTLAALAGIEAPPGLRGRDLSAVLAGEASIDDARVVFPAVLEPANKPQLPVRRVARRAELKRISGHPARPGDAGHLFDVMQDPAERADLRELRQTAVAELDAEIAAWEASLVLRPPVHQNTGRPLRAGQAPTAAELSPERIEELRQLGYVE